MNETYVAKYIWRGIQAARTISCRYYSPRLAFGLARANAAYLFEFMQCEEGQQAPGVEAWQVLAAVFVALNSSGMNIICMVISQRVKRN